jgi:hypothetical protein
VGPGFNAASVDRVDISHYPWFFIAKVKIYPYQIQESSALQESNQVTAIRMAASIGETPVTNLSATAI